jgi:hypothetical protein
MSDPTPRQIAREFVADIGNCTQDYAENTDGIAIDTLEEMIEAALAGQRERLAQLHDSIDPHCDHEKPGEGAGAMGAITRYRDAIRRGDV